MAKQRLNAEEAEALALKCLGFLAADAARLESFLKLTGLSVADLRAQAGERSTMAAVLDHLLSDQTLLLVFCADHGLLPEQVELARVEVSGVANPGVWL